MVTSFDVFDNQTDKIPDQNNPVKSSNTKNLNIDTVKSINSIKEEVKEKKDKKLRFV